MKNITVKGIAQWVTYDTNKRKFETKLHSPKEHRMESSTLDLFMLPFIGAVSRNVSKFKRRNLFDMKL